MFLEEELEMRVKMLFCLNVVVLSSINALRFFNL